MAGTLPLYYRNPILVAKSSFCELRDDNECDLMVLVQGAAGGGVELY